MTTLMQYADLSKPVLTPAPRHNRPNRRETRYPVVCPACARARLLSRRDISRERKTAICQDCTLRLNRLNHPTECEARVVDSLKAAGVKFEREYMVIDTDGSMYCIDFVINGWLALEINGEEHNLPAGCKRDERVRALWGDKLITIPNHMVIQSQFAAGNMVKAILGVMDIDGKGVKTC